MDNQTILNILLSIATVYLAIKNYLNTNRKDTMRESQEMTTIKVQLDQVMGMLRDVQKDMKNVSILSERVVKIETRLTEIYNRIDKLEEYHGRNEQ